MKRFKHTALPVATFMAIGFFVHFSDGTKPLSLPELEIKNRAASKVRLLLSKSEGTVKIEPLLSVLCSISARFSNPNLFLIILTLSSAIMI